MPQPRTYSAIQICLHWTVALLVIVQFIVNDDLRVAFHHRIIGDSDAGLGSLPPGATFHILSGLLILALTTLRLAIRLIRGAPPPEDGIPPVLRYLASATHALFYGFLILMPVTGAVAWFLKIEASAILHEIGRLILLPAILAHAFGAVVEHLVLRNDTLRRMLAMTDR